MTDQVDIYIFRIQGELVHYVDSLLFSLGQSPRFAQIYIYDSDSHRQVQQRMGYHHENVDESTLLSLQNMLRDLNPYFASLITAEERLHNNEHISLRLKTIDLSHLDHRRYNQFTIAEVVVIMSDTEKEDFNC